MSLPIVVHTKIHSLAHALAASGRDHPNVTSAFFILFEDERPQIREVHAGIADVIESVLDDADEQGRLVWVKPEEYKDLFEITNELLGCHGIAAEIDEYGHSYTAYVQKDLETRLRESLGPHIVINV